VGDLLHGVADSMPLWRDAVVGGLACIVIGAIYLYATIMGEP